MMKEIRKNSLLGKFPGSSNGRTLGSEPGNLRSNRSPGAQNKSAHPSLIVRLRPKFGPWRFIFKQEFIIKL